MSGQLGAAARERDLRELWEHTERRDHEVADALVVIAEHAAGETTTAPLYRPSTGNHTRRNPRDFRRLVALLRMTRASRYLPVLALTGCYSTGVPAVVKPPPPPLHDGTAVVTTEEGREGDYYIDYKGDIKKSYYRVGDAKYGDQELTFAQVSALGDPDWDKKLDHLRDLRHTCKRGRIPEYAGMAGVAAMSLLGIGLIIVNKGNESNDISTLNKVVLLASFGSGGFGIASYAFGYAIGGHACDDVRTYRKKLELDSTETRFVDTELDLVKKMAANFNTQHGVSPPAEATATSE